MSWWIWLLIGLVALIILFFVWKFLTRNSGTQETFSRSSAMDFFQKVKDKCCELKNKFK